MNVVDLPLDRITPAPWNANRMDAPMRGRLAASRAVTASYNRHWFAVREIVSPVAPE